ncbi:MAG TPA: DNA mismatch repair endonuclease MutL [Balneolales bacterium]|nr:DNA mismatch repair endonuclease MutL [Balneolales bacterium]
MNSELQTSEGIIHIMPPELSNKIAAGEVVQRPGSVLKELLDNAIDSGADHIKVISQNAGRTLIQVSDNGSGMSQADLKLSVQRHATSKISRIEDLYGIRTLGFRGEALASIASVAQVTITSKRMEDETGFVYEVWGGENKHLEPAPAENGTSVAVRNLFFNVPARRAFLKTDATEFRHILLAFQHAVMSNPDIHFELNDDGEEIYNLPSQSLEDRIVMIFGRSYRASLIRVGEQTDYMGLSGYIIDPKMAKKNRGEQFFFVNGRPFQHRHLMHVVLNIYNQWIQPNQYPFFALYFDVDPAEVDVNVHPTKLEVKFGDERTIAALTKSVIRKSLNEQFQVPAIPQDNESLYFDEHTAFRTDFESGNQFIGSGKPGSDPIRIPSRINYQPNREKIPEDVTRRLYAGTTGPTPLNQPGRKNHPEYDKGRGFWQLHNQYILSQTLTGLCIIDQHTAHRRIIYERALQAAESGLPSTQQLLFPQTLEFSATDFALLRELHPTIQKMGFNIQLLSGNSAIVSGVPADIQIGNEKNVLESILEQFQSLSGKVQLKERERVALALASKTAIPRGKKLTDIEMETIIDQLFACEQPYFDPLNNPTIIYLPLDEIATRFR